MTVFSPPSQIPKTSTLWGIGCMLMAMTFLPVMDVLAKTLVHEISLVQIVWARFFFGAVFLVPIVYTKRGGVCGFRVHHLPFQILRSVLLLLATAFFIYSLRFQTPAETLSIFFVMPLVVTAFSPLVLGEHVGIHRWAAVFVGFFGTLLVIRPGFSTLTIGIFSALGAGVTQAFFMLLTRKFAQTTDLLAMIFHTNFWSMLFLTPLVILYWDAGTTLHHITLMMLVGLISMCAHFFIIEAYASAPAPVIAPIVYWEMVPATLVGYALYHKIPDFWTFVGVGILSLSACYIAYREHLHRKQRIS